MRQIREFFAHRGLALSCCMFFAAVLLEFPGRSLVPKMVLAVLILSRSQPHWGWMVSIMGPWLLKSGLSASWVPFYGLDSILLFLGAFVYSSLGHWLRFLECMSVLVTVATGVLSYAHSYQYWDMPGVLKLVDVLALSYPNVLGLIATELLVVTVLSLFFSLRWAERLFDHPKQSDRLKRGTVHRGYVLSVLCFLCAAYMLGSLGWMMPAALPVVYIGHRLVLAWARSVLRGLGYVRATLLYYSLLCLCFVTDVVLLIVVFVYAVLGVLYSIQQMRFKRLRG